jgi:hypothetical protein
VFAISRDSTPLESIENLARMISPRWSPSDNCGVCIRSKSEGFVITVSREEDRLYARATGQRRNRLFPESESRFFLRTVDAQFEFIRHEQGAVNELILYQGGFAYRASRIE